MAVDLKAEAEAVPLGSIQLFGLGDRVDFQDGVKAAVVQLINEQFSRGFGECALVRQIFFAENFGDEVRRWQLALGEPVGHTNDAYGSAGGKTLTWGNGTPTGTFAVIIVLGGIADALLAGRPLARGLVVHELGHVAHNFHLLGANVKHPRISLNDLDSLLMALALNMQAEAWAEIAAGPYWSEEELAQSVNLTVDVTKAAWSAAGKAVEDHDATPDFTRIWTEIIRCTSSVTTQLGRTIGLTTSFAANNRIVEAPPLQELIEAIDPFIARVFAELRLRCLESIRSEKPVVEALVDLKASILDLMTVFGVCPEQRGDRVWVQLV
jgi:hypothetical protein